MSGQSSAHSAPASWLDGIAVSASALCLVHCLALPFIAAGLPMLGLLVEHHEAVHKAGHWALLALALSIGIVALGHGRAA